MSKNMFFVIVLASFSSCISSLHQLVTYDKVITDNRITGHWQQDDKTEFIIEDLLTSHLYKSAATTTADEKETSMGFENREDSLLYSKSYTVSFTKSGYNYTMIASLMRLGDEIYADLLPVSALRAASQKKEDAFDGNNYLPSHSLAKIIFAGPSLKLKFLNGDFIKKKLQEGVIAVKYEDDDLFKTTFITASPDELQRFLVKYGKDERLFSDANTITLKKI